MKLPALELLPGTRLASTCFPPRCGLPRDGPRGPRHARQISLVCSRFSHLLKRNNMGHFRIRCRVLPAGSARAAFSPAEDRYVAKMRRLQNIDVLILDDFLTIGINQREQEDLTKIIFNRDGRLPTIIVSQTTAAYWVKKLTRPRRSRFTGQQTQYRTAHRTRRLRHAPTPGKRRTWCQRVVDRIRGPAAGPDKTSCRALPPSRNPSPTTVSQHAHQQAARSNLWTSLANNRNKLEVSNRVRDWVRRKREVEEPMKFKDFIQGILHD